MTAAVLRDVPTWDALKDLYGKVSHDDEAGRLVLAEMRRRERLEAQRRERKLEAMRYEDALQAQLEDATRACNGCLVGPEGIAAGLPDERMLWRGPEALARKWASWELNAYWDASPRLTLTQWQDQRAAGRRIQRDERDAEATEPTEGGPMTGEIAQQAPAAATREASGLGREERARLNAQQAVAHRSEEIRAANAVAVHAPAALVKRERDPVDADKLLRETRKFLKHFALWPSQAALDVATLAVAAMHAKDPENGLPVWEYAFRLLFTGPYGSGKSWFAKLVASLAPSGKVLLEPTKPSLIDMIADRNTVVITEVDELLATPGRNRGIVAVANASYEPGHYHTRKQGGKVQEVHLFGHMILDGAELTKATRTDLRAIVTRSLALYVKSAPDGYRRPRWDKTAQAIAARGRDRLATWMAQEVADGIADVVPELPEGLGSPRRCSLWEPLFTTALRADQAAARRDGRGDDPEMYWTAVITEAAPQIESALGLPDEEEDAENELDRIMSEWEE